MSTQLQARIGAVAFLLWGLMHVAGGSLILVSVLGDVDAGYAYYGQSAGPFPPVAGQILAYLAYSFAWIGVAVALIAITLNWRNSALGLAFNTGLVLATDFGLIVFLIVPGHISWPEAAPGLVLLALGASFGGMACTAPAGVQIRSRKA